MHEPNWTELLDILETDCLHTRVRMSRNVNHSQITSMHSTADLYLLAHTKLSSPITMCKWQGSFWRKELHYANKHVCQLKYIIFDSIKTTQERSKVQNSSISFIKLVEVTYVFLIYYQIIVINWWSYADLLSLLSFP